MSIRLDINELSGELYDASVRAFVGRLRRRDALQVAQDCNDTANALRDTGVPDVQPLALDLRQSARLLLDVAQATGRRS